MADRDQMLAEFQAFTGIEDFAHSIAVLEQHDWNLMEAVQNTMAGMDAAPGEMEEAPPPSYEQISSGYEPLGEGVIGRRITNILTEQSDDSASGAAGASAYPDMPISSATALGFSAGPSTSSERIRLLNFHIEYRDKTHNLVVPDNEKVEKIKELLENMIGVSKEEMQLRGWVSKSDNRIADSDILSELKLPKDNTLFLLTPHVLPSQGASSNGEQSPDMTEKLSQTYSVNVINTDTGKSYLLNFPGTKTIQEIKGDIYALTSIPARHQVWTGWPDHVDSDATLTIAASGITSSHHTLQVKSKEDNTSSTPHIVEISSDSDSDDDFQDANYHDDDDVMFDHDAPMTRKLEPLMPENAKDQTAALEHFVREFSSRYGDNHPVFYIGTLENALKDSLQCKARERKLLAVYLHHDGSILTNVFCSQILCADAVINYLASHFILWAWDLTSEANKARLISMCTQHFGSVAANTVRSFKADEMPLLLIISRNRATNEVVQVLRGNLTVDELVPHLMHCQEVFQQQVTTDIAEEDERDARERIKQEQEDAYMESLKADRIKAQAKQAEEDARREQEKLELEQRMREEDERRMHEEHKAAISKSLADQLPEEPEPDCGEPVSMIRIRAPGNQILVRRFLAQQPLQVLLNYVASEGFHTQDYKVLTTFPRRDLTQLDTTQSLETLKLFPQETVTLEEK